MSDMNQNWNVSTNFSKVPPISNFVKPFSDSRDRQTDIAKPIGAFIQLSGERTSKGEEFAFDDDQWRYSPDRALASLYGSFYRTMWVISSTIDIF
jgi:hypothetical protein